MVDNAHSALLINCKYETHTDDGPPPSCRHRTVGLVTFT